VIRTIHPWVVLVLGLVLRVQGQVLFDGVQGTPPSGQGWTFLALPALASETFANGAARLDTTASGSIFAGWSRTSTVPLDRSQGFAVEMEFELQSETHASTNRAGLSLIVLGADRKGLELGIWTNRLWAQADSPMFTQAEGVETAVIGGWRTLRLSVLGDAYTVTFDGVQVLNGAVRDYTPFTGAIDPYETPNFLFIGDDTTSARGAYRLRRVQLQVGTAQPPVMNFRRGSDDALDLSWDAAGGVSRWKLESAAALDGPWTVHDVVRTELAGEVRVSVRTLDEARWFRLR
jgi:hypothetical protein